MENQHFFMVSLEGERTTTAKYSVIELAENEAKRLAKMYNKKAYVLCSLKSFEVNEFTVKDCRPDTDDLPFYFAAFINQSKIQPHFYQWDGKSLVEKNIQKSLIYQVNE